MFRSSLVLAFLSAVVATETVNLLTNPGFEDDLSSSTSEWTTSCATGSSCGMSRVVEAYSGDYCALLVDRDNDADAISHPIDTTPGSIYRVGAMVNLQSSASEPMYQTIYFKLACMDGAGLVEQHIIVGESPYGVPGEWQEVGGVVKIEADQSDCRIYIKTAAPVEYLMDDAFVYEIPVESDWQTYANDRIDQYRKSDINVQVKISGCSTKGNTEIELTQTGSAFAIGTAVNAEDIVSNEAYKTVFYENFNWATLENALKWRQTEPSQNQIDYNTAKTALNALIANGIKQRCHNVFWSREEFVPDWVKPLYDDTLVAAIEARIDSVVSEVEGMCDHWDVNNENLLEDFFEAHTHDVNITMDMFRTVHATDELPELYINENHAIDGESAVAIKARALQFLSANVPINGIGLEAHITTSTEDPFDIDLARAGLEIVEEAELPIVVTALVAKNSDENVKADLLTQLMTLFYSSPLVTGVNLWGYWDGNMYETEGALYNGNDVTPNAAGLAFEELINNVWSTQSTTELRRSKSFSVRGFKGDYTLKVKRDGVVIHEKQFTLGDDASLVRVRIGASGSVTARVTAGRKR